MLGISYSCAVNNRLIPIKNENYEVEAYIKDGENLKIRSSFEGKTRIYPCKYIDYYHFYCGSTVFHIDQFAELMARNGNSYRPENVIKDLELYEKVFFDRSLLGPDGKIIPYHKIVVECSPCGFNDFTFCAAICPLAEKDKQVCIFTHTGDDYEKRFMSAERCLEHLDGNLGSSLGGWDRATFETLVFDLAHSISRSSLDIMIKDAKNHSSEYKGLKSTSKHNSPSDKGR